MVSPVTSYATLRFCVSEQHGFHVSRQRSVSVATRLQLPSVKQFVGASCGESQHTIRRILFNFPGTSHQLLQNLKDKYIEDPGTTVETPTEYTGFPNETLDQLITSLKLMQALNKHTRNTTPSRRVTCSFS